MIKAMLVLVLLLIFFHPVYAEPMGILEIPSIGVDAPIVEMPFIALSNRGSAWDFTGLGSKVAHLEKSQWVGEQGNIALSGHVDQVFMRLHELEEGDSIFIIVDHEQFEYRVIETYVQQHPVVLYTSLAERLTIVTCHGWNGFDWTDRLVVIAERVQ